MAQPELAQSRNAFESRANRRGLVLPDMTEPEQPPIAFNGHEYVLTESQKHGAGPRFTYCCGEAMVGQSEQPCCDTTKLVASRHRYINAPDNTKAGYLWAPGNRYTNRVRTSLWMSFVTHSRARQTPDNVCSACVQPQLPTIAVAWFGDAVVAMTMYNAQCTQADTHLAA